MCDSAKTISSFRNPHSAIRNAFTLIELICVLAILGIIAGVVVPHLFGFMNSRSIYNTGTRVLAIAHYAHDNAITDSTPYRLNYDASDQAIWLTKQSGSTYAAVPGEWGQKLTMTPGLTIDTNFARQDDGTYVAFQPTGRTDAGVITLSDTGGRSIRIACTSATELFRTLADNEVTK